jgi:hypothetical protein
VNTSGATEAGGDIAAALLAWFLGCVGVYAALFGTGYFLYGRVEISLLCGAIAAASAYGLSRVVPKIGF